MVTYMVFGEMAFDFSGGLADNLYAFAKYLNFTLVLQLKTHLRNYLLLAD